MAKSGSSLVPWVVAAVLALCVLLSLAQQFAEDKPIQQLIRSRERADEGFGLWERSGKPQKSGRAAPGVLQLMAIDRIRLAIKSIDELTREDLEPVLGPPTTELFFYSYVHGLECLLKAMEANDAAGIRRGIYMVDQFPRFR